MVSWPRRGERSAAAKPAGVRRANLQSRRNKRIIINCVSKQQRPTGLRLHVARDRPSVRAEKLPLEQAQLVDRQTNDFSFHRPSIAGRTATNEPPPPNDNNWPRLSRLLTNDNRPLLCSARRPSALPLDRCKSIDLKTDEIGSKGIRSAMRASSRHGRPDGLGSALLN